MVGFLIMAIMLLYLLPHTQTLLRKLNPQPSLSNSHVFFCIHHTFFWTLLIAKSQYFIAIHKSKINSMKTIICVLTTTSAYQSFRVHGIVIEKIDDVWHSLMVLSNDLLAFHRYSAKYDQHCVACFQLESCHEVVVEITKVYQSHILSSFISVAHGH